MKDSNILHNRTLTIEITGVSSKSKEEAVNTAFRNLKAEVSKVVTDLIVYMKPLEVELKGLESEEYTERFLFIFMPRKHEKVKITLSVKVEIATLSI